MQDLGVPDALKINEWLANGTVLFADDFIELYNPDLLPVDLSGMFLSDNPIAQPDRELVLMRCGPASRARSATVG